MCESLLFGLPRGLLWGSFACCSRFAFFHFSRCFNLLVCFHRTWITPCDYTKFLHRRCRAAVGRPLNARHDDFAEHPESFRQVPLFTYLICWCLDAIAALRALFPLLRDVFSRPRPIWLLLRAASFWFRLRVKCLFYFSVLFLSLRRDDFVSTMRRVFCVTLSFCYYCFAPVRHKLRGISYEAIA